MAAGLPRPLTAATAERQEASDPGTSSTPDTDAAEDNEESRDTNQESPEEGPGLALVVHAVREEIQAAHVGGDALPSVDGTKEGGEVVVIPARNVDLLVISGKN